MFISAHAVTAYQERVYACGPRRAHAEIEEAFGSPLFACQADSGDILWGLRNRSGFVFIGVTPASGERAEVLTVGPCWYWHEARPYYRRWMKSRRRWA